MIPSRKTFALAVAGLASLTWIGVSAAAEGDDPVLSDEVEVVVDDTPTTETTETTVTTEGDEADEPATDDAPAAEHPENHGKYVSEAAHTCPAGPGHGECVRAVAQSDEGKAALESDGDEDEPLATDEAIDDSDEADEADDDSTEGATTEESGHGASRGRSAGHGEGQPED